MNKTIAFTFSNPAMCEKAAKGAPDVLAAWYAAVSRDEWQQAVLKDLKAAGDWAKKAPTAAAQLVAYIGGASAPTVPTVPAPTNPGNRPHVAGFLMQSKGLYSHTFFSAKTTDAERAEMIKQHLANGYTTMYVYAANDNDYSGKSVRYSHADKARWRNGLSAILEAGMSVIMWMRADDSPTLNKWTGEQVDAYNRQAVADMDDMIDGYVIGLEVNEYWTADFTRARVKAMKGMTDKPVGVHTGRIDDIAYADTADVYYLQYGFNKSESEIASKTRAAIKRWSGAKSVIAAEYSMNSHTDAAKRLGDAAIRAGAVGVGNGCSAAGIALLSCGAVNQSTEPTPSTFTAKWTSFPAFSFSGVDRTGWKVKTVDDAVCNAMVYLDGIKCEWVRDGKDASSIKNATEKGKKNENVTKGYYRPDIVSGQTKRTTLEIRDVDGKARGYSTVMVIP